MTAQAVLCQRIAALSGGVGGARLVDGLSSRLSTERLTVLCNTGDDFRHLGLWISPDLDTVMYTLAGIADPERGWGLADESWRVMGTLDALGGPGWFRLGDRDLATHLARTDRLARGWTLTEVTDELCRRLGVGPRLLPMSDDPVSTRVTTDEGEMPFQDYFVREQCRPAVRDFAFAGADRASPHPELLAMLRRGEVDAVVICPSNPFVSVAPILSLPGMREALRGAGVPVVAVSPVVAGAALKGPTTKMMGELGLAQSAGEVARYYRGLLDGFVLDEVDAGEAEEVAATGATVRPAQTVMRSAADRRRLADAVLAFTAELARGSA